jgi:hypothetical protein
MLWLWQLHVPCLRSRLHAGRTFQHAPHWRPLLPALQKSLRLDMPTRLRKLLPAQSDRRLFDRFLSRSTSAQASQQTDFQSLAAAWDDTRLLHGDKVSAVSDQDGRVGTLTCSMQCTVCFVIQPGPFVKVWLLQKRLGMKARLCPMPRVVET